MTAGTIFDRSRIPLQEWFAAAWYMTNGDGVSALGLRRLLGLGSYQTAWTMLQKLRTAIVGPGQNRLRGRVEVGETCVGGVVQGVCGLGTRQKFIVGIAIEVFPPYGFGRVILRRIHDVSCASLVPFVCGAVEPGAEVCTNGWEGYNDIPEHGYKLNPNNLLRMGDPSHVSMPGVCAVAWRLEHWFRDTRQGSVTAAHLDAHLDEFAFRIKFFCSRRRGSLFLRLLQHAVVTAPTRYRPSRPA